MLLVLSFLRQYPNRTTHLIHLVLFQPLNVVDKRLCWHDARLKQIHTCCEDVGRLSTAYDPQVLASVARDIDVFGELHGTRTLEMHGTLLALVHLRRSMPSVYKLIAHQQNKSASPRKVKAHNPISDMSKNFSSCMNLKACPSKSRSGFYYSDLAGRIMLIRLTWLEETKK